MSHVRLLPRSVARARRGLTLIEILIVIALLLVLGGLLLVNFMPQKADAELKMQRAQFDQVASALQQFKLNMQRLPTEEEGLTVLWDKSVLANEDDAARWVGPYVVKPIKDVWETELVYHCPGELNPQSYDLISFGPDKQEGTEDDLNNASSQGVSGSNADSADGFAPPPDPGSGGTGGSGG